MSTALASTTIRPEAILDRQGFRRSTGIPTVSLLACSLEVGPRAWRIWSTAAGRRSVITRDDAFPADQWLAAACQNIDLLGIALHRLAQRSHRDPEEFVAEWKNKTQADRRRFWNAYSGDQDEDLLRVLERLQLEPESTRFTDASSNESLDWAVAKMVQLNPNVLWPSVLFIADSNQDLTLIARTGAKWALLIPSVPVAIAVPENVWEWFLTTTPESQVKALLREGEVRIPVIESLAITEALVQAGSDNQMALGLTDCVSAVADSSLVAAAAEAIQARATATSSKADDDRARSAAERFLFEFLERLPETAGRFELNGKLDFKFGNRAAEVDLVCHEPRIALEIDGYFHFVDAENYRRDRMKDWELQRRGYVVLRFLADDILPRLDSIRDRIFEALANDSQGEIR